MAIIDGRRFEGLDIVKMKGRKEWVLHDRRSGEFYALPVSVDTDDPVPETFRYCSAQRQSVFVDYFVGPLNTDLVTPSSWKKVPPQWKQIFLRDVPYLFDEEFWAYG